MLLVVFTASCGSNPRFRIVTSAPSDHPSGTGLFGTAMGFGEVDRPIRASLLITSTGSPMRPQRVAFDPTHMRYGFKVPLPPGKYLVRITSPEGRCLDYGHAVIPRGGWTYMEIDCTT
jgi:hypothetical protein